MESLSETSWDVVIDGTGLQQSLLALALSRSDKKVLHVDANSYYGGPEAAFSLQEVEEWVKKVSEDETSAYPFSHASITTSTENAGSNPSASKLSFSRAYTLTLSPQIIYSKSKLLSQLVSSKVYKQLEFQAVGNWWIYDADGDGAANNDSLKRLPNGREDIFSDRSIDVRAKRGLMKFLKFVVDYEAQSEVWEPHADASLPEFLSGVFQLPPAMQIFIAALTLSVDPPSETKVRYSLPRIARHLTSIGVFGPGFGAVIPKWGGGSEIAQVACRSGAVGGGIYILGSGINSIKSSESDPKSIKVALADNEEVTSKLVVQVSSDRSKSNGSSRRLSKSITIVASDLSHLFTSSVEGAPTAAVTVVTFPSSSLILNNQSEKLPVYVMVHSSETGECPAGQCVLYASTRQDDNARSRLNLAVAQLLSSIPSEEPQTSSNSSSNPVEQLYCLYYEQESTPTSSPSTTQNGIYHLSPSSLELAFDDSMLTDVEEAWKVVMSSTDTSNDSPEAPFMVFEDRRGMNDDGDFDEV